MNRWSLGYEILRFFVKLIHDWFYRRIIIIGKKNIPQKKPVVFAPNHQNALMDPLAIIFTNKLQTVFLTRSDIFHPIIVPVFSFLKMLPVYRIRDGADSLKNNERIFNKSVEILESNMSMALFPEALHFGKRSLRPLKKAIPRIVFQAEEKNDFDLDIQIVPVGIYYDNYTDSNSLLQVNYGEPIRVNDFKKTYDENPKKAMLELRNAIAKGIKPLIIDIEDLDNYELYETLRYLLRKPAARKFKIKAPNKNWFIIDKKIIDIISNLDEESFDKLKNLYEKFVEKYRQTGLKSYEIKKTNWLKFIINNLMLVAGFPIFVFALINNALPYFLLMNFLRKNVKDLQFHSSIKFGFGLFILPVYYLLLSLIPYAITGDYYWTYFILLAVTGLITVKYKLLYKITKTHAALIRARVFRRESYAEMMNIFKQISDIVLK